VEGDLDLVRRAADGDRAAFHGIVDRYADDLYRVAVSMVGNPEDAEDILQETFFAAFRRIQTFEGRSALKTWLIGILVRQVGKHRRYWKIRKWVSLQSLTGEAKADYRRKTAVDPAGRMEASLDVRAMLESLSRKYREAIVLREIQGLSYEEIGEALGIPIGTVESRLFRARQELKEKFGDYLD